MVGSSGSGDIGSTSARTVSCWASIVGDRPQGFPSNSDAGGREKEFVVAQGFPRVRDAREFGPCVSGDTDVSSPHPDNVLRPFNSELLSDGSSPPLFLRSFATLL